MNWKTFLIGFLLITCYLAIYLLTGNLRREEQLQSATSEPLVLLPVCEKAEDISLGFADEGTLCTSKTALYKYFAGKKSMLGSWAENKLPMFLLATQNIILAYEGNLLNFYDTTDFKILYTLKVSANSYPISALTYQDTCFVTVINNVSKPSENKTTFYRVKLQDFATTSFSTIAMYKVTDIFKVEDTFILFLSEAFPFLVPKKAVLVWDKHPELVKTSCPISSFGRNADIIAFQACTKWQAFQNALTPVEINYSKLPNLLISTKRYNIVFDDKEKELRWTSTDQKGTPKTLLVLNELPALELRSKMSTSIDKRVYNCFDFTESLQITLRVCIPNHE